MRNFESAQVKRYDIIVVGGGVYGAAIAWEAVSRGLTVALLESHDFGHATSANSLKIIHGGIRYLQNLDIQRLRESVHERRALLRIAPHLVSPLKCILPIQNTLTKNRLTVGTAFNLYNYLSKNRNEGVDPSRQIPSSGVMKKKELIDEMPLLKDIDCAGAGYWYDAQAHNTERLVLSFVLSAAHEGGTVLNYASAEALLTDGEAVDGVVVRDSLSNNCFELRSDAVVDCTGYRPNWYNELSDSDIASTYVKAVNLVVQKKILPCAIGLNAQAVGSKENRQLFVTPWRGQSIVGTWYFNTSDKPKHVKPTKQEFDECLWQANSLVPGISIEANDISVVHSGLLPAKRNNDKTRQPVLMRKPIISDASEHGGPSGLFCVQGVKLTTARGVAQLTIDRICSRLNKRASKSETDSRPLYGGNLGEVGDYYKYKQYFYAGILSVEAITRLIDNYGTNIDVIMSYIKKSPKFGRLVPGTTSLLCAELIFVIEHEIVVTLSDLMLRRVDTGAYGMPKQETIEFCAKFLGKQRGWNESTKLENINSLMDSYLLSK